MALLNTKEPYELTALQQMNGLLSIAGIAAGLKIEIWEYFHQSEWVVPMDRPLDTVEVVMDEGQSMGLEMITRDLLPIDKRYTIMNDKENDPMSGTWLMMYNFHEPTKTLFYWQTKMLVIKYDMKPYRKAIQ